MLIHQLIAGKFISSIKKWIALLKMELCYGASSYYRMAKPTSNVFHTHRGVIYSLKLFS